MVLYLPIYRYRTFRGVTSHLHDPVIDEPVHSDILDPVIGEPDNSDWLDAVIGGPDHSDWLDPATHDGLDHSF